MERLSLRFRIFLFFVLLGLGGAAIVFGGLMLGLRTALNGSVQQGFVQAGLVSMFGLIGLAALIWMLFDENVAKPIERLAARLRAGAHAGVSRDDDGTGKYLGDLAPATSALTQKLSETSANTAGAITLRTEQLQREKDRLTALLTEIPVAMVLVNAQHQIVLYDGQAAEVLAAIQAPRLNAPIADYFDFDTLEAAWAKLSKTGKDLQFDARSVTGEQSYTMRMQPLDNGAGYMLIIDAAEIHLSPDAARPLVYDFGLLDQSQGTAVDETRLSDLTFVVFDTETTGLLPHKDDVVQIGALRVLRGSIVSGERFDTLVNPGRPIPESSTRVHGVTDAMVADAPDIATAVMQFHKFASQAVVVAHNAPFDMAFMNKYGSKLGLTWDNPVLDTVLASAVLFGASEDHTLDDLADRLGIEISQVNRHTAMGDAKATADVLCHLIPMLEARGIETFGDLLEQTRKHGRILKDLN